MNPLTYPCVLSTFLVGIFLCLLDSGLASSRMLDPAVFKKLSKFRLPDVVAGKAFDIDFSFSASENTIIDAVSYNASYSPNIELQTVSLSIPLDEINMEGAFYSTLNLTFEENIISSRNSSGQYNLQLRNVNLYFLVKFDFTLQGVELSLNKCDPGFEDHVLKLEHSLENPDSITYGLMHRLTMVAAEEEFKQMFCNALNKVIKPDTKDPISTALQAAILQRIQESFYPKSG